MQKIQSKVGNMQLPSLSAPAYTKEEQEQIVVYVSQLTKDEIRSFLRDHKIRITGTKEDLKVRLTESIRKKVLSFKDLVQLIDRVEPWGKQHLYLYRGQEALLTQWRDPQFVKSHLKQHRAGRYLNQCLPLILPPKLTLSSIEHTSSVLRITAIERRDSFERDEAFDESRVDDGTSIELRAYKHEVSRGIVAFEWNLSTNHAMLQITQLPRHSKYEDARDRFAKLTEKWISLSQFTPIDMRLTVKNLHVETKNNPNSIRAHGIGFTSLAGRKLFGRSASADMPLLGEAVIDNALDSMNQQGTAHEGNFFFLGNGTTGNPIQKDAEVHVIMMADKGRISFTTSNGEDVLRYVLGRIRNASK